MRYWLCLLVLGGLVHAVLADENHDTTDPPLKGPRVLETVVVDKIWSAVSVRFCLLTHGDMQYVAYYDADRNMAVAQRKLTESAFRDKTVLPSKQGWDSHNYITMAVDSEGYLHLSGNMHAVALVYFRSEKPGDITTLTQVKSMVGDNEARCTYPKFLRDRQGRMLFHYRSGGSGNGNEVYNIYDEKSRTWSRLLDTPLTDGKGKMNAYQVGPDYGPDGYYHLCWVWRDTPDASTNHDLSYARSKDLVHWESAAGEAIKLPITLDMTDLIVDPVPVNGGLLNGLHRIGFDPQNRPIITYHKYDDQGKSQVYAARFESGSWKVRQLTQWDFRWVFGGRGSLGSTPNQVGVDAVKSNNGQPTLSFGSSSVGFHTWVLDEPTLQPLRTLPEAPRYPPELTRVQSKFPGMGVMWVGDIGESTQPDGRYFLRWECLGKHGDRPREEPLPESSDLVVYKIGP